MLLFGPSYVNFSYRVEGFGRSMWIAEGLHIPKGSALQIRAFELRITSLKGKR